MKKGLWFVLFGVVLSLMACSKKPQVNVTPSKIDKSNVPTVFIHGYKGWDKTMSTMTKSLEKSQLTQQEMVMTVSATGEVSVETDLEGAFKKNNPTIRLSFENNTNHQWDQAEWIKAALHELKDSFQVEEVNLVGFSMGGISSLLYLETFSNDESLPKVNKVISIGSPFNDFLEDDEQTLEDLLTSGPTVVGETLENYTNLVGNIPKETSFYLIGGQLSESELTDGTVPLNSSLGVYSLLASQGLNVKESIIMGSEAKHSNLKLNEEVIQLVANYLYLNE